MGLSFDNYVDTITEEGMRLSESLTDGLTRKLSTCPGWTGTDLIDHLGQIYVFWIAQLEAADAEQRAEFDPSRFVAGDVESFEAALSALAAKLTSVGADSPCWNWAGDDPTADWVAKRMALENAIHRVDAELASGKAHAIEAELAVEGIEERLELFIRRGLKDHPQASLGGTLCLIAQDIDAAFVVEVERGRLRWRSGRGPADAVLVGSASDLYLFTWNRLDPSALSLTGDSQVATAWAGLPG